MAFGKVARRTVVSDVAALLDSPEISALILELESLRDSRGRKGYGARALVGACLTKSLFGIPTWTMVAALIAEHPGLQDALGGKPSCWAMYRFATKLRANRPALAACLDACAASLQTHHPDMGRDVAVDATDVPAWGNGQRFIMQGGPERERFSDPDASWGHRSALATRGAGSFYGFKLHAAICTETGLPLAWEVATGRRHESNFVAPLIDAMHARGYTPETVACDKAYDNNRVYAEIEQRGCDPIIPLRGAKGKQVALPVAVGGRLFPRIARHTEQFKRLYKRRVMAEREFGRLKHEQGLATLRVRGLAKVQQHADLTILARLGQALLRAREETELAAA
jgi:hypothetical protein